MESNIIFGALYTELDDKIGPNPIFWTPNSLSEEVRMHVGIKSITILTGEKGAVPKSLCFLPFPSKNLKGLIKFMSWPDKSRRGNIGTSALTILFKEHNDVIFYKYVEEIESLINRYAVEITNQEKSNADQARIKEIYESLIEGLNSLLDELRLKEHVAHHEPFPELRSKNQEIYQFKIAVCGDPMVGKTSLITRFIDKAFNASYLPTLGVSVSNKFFPYGNEIIQLVIWDIAGQIKFQRMRTAFYKGARGILLTFDLTNRTSFESIRLWHDDVKNNMDSQEVIGLLIGNKSDLREKRAISESEIKTLVNELGFGFIETSALNGDNVEQIFISMGKKLLDVLK